MSNVLQNDSERIVTLVRVFRAACKCGDVRLRDAAIAELKVYGIGVVELPIRSRGSEREDKSRG